MIEAAIVAAVLRRLRSLGPELVVEKIHGSAYQPAMLDLHGCYRGAAFVIEVKVPGQKLTPRQRATLDKWSRAGARGGMATSADEAEAIVLGRTTWG